ncbi:hypothetical protein B566_EDAN014452 [Ephemera danica]|nr:hypothetical protein B566_EDAN014452 [Ephemera danica]
MSCNPDIQASVCEILFRTLKTRMWRYFTHKETNRYIDVLDDLLHAYNHTYFLMTSLIHNLSCECTNGELDLFQEPVTQLSDKEGSCVCIKPVAVISNDTTLEIHIPAQSEEYIDPIETQLLNVFFTTLSLQSLVRNTLQLKKRCKLNSFAAATVVS